MKKFKVRIAGRQVVEICYFEQQALIEVEAEDETHATLIADQWIKEWMYKREEPKGIEWQSPHGPEAQVGKRKEYLVFGVDMASGQLSKD
jgi:hypothetical protein